MKDMINITGVNLIELAQHVYDLSAPQGMGFLHFEDSPLSDDDAIALIDNDSKIPLSMDYVKGRACKMTVFKDDMANLFIRPAWHDHCDSLLDELLNRIGK